MAVANSLTALQVSRTDEDIKLIPRDSVNLRTGRENQNRHNEYIRFHDVFHYRSYILDIVRLTGDFYYSYIQIESGIRHPTIRIRKIGFDTGNKCIH